MSATVSLADHAGRIDLAVIAVPAQRVASALEDAGRAGVPAAVVISSGFGEMGEAGADLQRGLAGLARSLGMRVVGPNCLGLVCNDPQVRLNATFNGSVPPPGGLAVASQSGGVGIVLMDLAGRTDLGVRYFVSLGNKADVSSNDLLAAWYDDDQVTCAALYLESFGNARKFARFARRFSERKPLLAAVGGRSSGGRRAGVSHTAAAASPEVAVRALFAQAGVIGCTDAEELVGHRPIPHPRTASRRATGRRGHERRWPGSAGRGRRSRHGARRRRAFRGGTGADRAAWSTRRPAPVTRWMRVRARSLTRSPRSRKPSWLPARWTR